MSTAGAQGGESGAGEEEMEDHEAGRLLQNVSMLTAGGTKIPVSVLRSVPTEGLFIVVYYEYYESRKRELQDSSSVSEPNIRLTLKPNRRRNPALV